MCNPSISAILSTSCAGSQMWAVTATSEGLDRDTSDSAELSLDDEVPVATPESRRLLCSVRLFHRSTTNVTSFSQTNAPLIGQQQYHFKQAIEKGGKTTNQDSHIRPLYRLRQ